MNLASWLREVLFRYHGPSETYHLARQMITDVQENTKSLTADIRKYDPFRGILRDLDIQKKVSEFDQKQAKEIYDSSPDGKVEKR